MTTTFSPRAPEDASGLATISVQEAMHRGVITCAPDAVLTTVARTMAAHRIHSVVVPLDVSLGSWGIVSDLDLVGALSSAGASERTAREFAASGRLTVRSDDTLARAAQLLHDYGETHLIVLDRSARPVGVLSTLDVVDALVELVPEDEPS